MKRVANSLSAVFPIRLLFATQHNAILEHPIQTRNQN